MFSVSVIIPVYNCAEFIEKAVESALYHDVVKEVLLIEDGSQDNGLHVCQRLAAREFRVRLLQHIGGLNMGASASRNLGIRSALFEYVAFLDGDDYFLPNRFDLDIEVFKTSRYADGVYNGIGIHYYSDKARIEYRDTKGQEFTSIFKQTKPENLHLGLLRMIPGFGHLHLDGLTVKRNVLLDKEIYFDTTLRIHQDNLFLVQLAYVARLYPGELKQPTAIRGVHDNNRITEVRKKKSSRHRNLLKLYRKIFMWAQTVEMRPSTLVHIRRLRDSEFIIACGWVLFPFLFFYYTVVDRSLIISPMYYDGIHRGLFGDGNLARFALDAKNKLQLYLHKP